MFGSNGISPGKFWSSTTGISLFPGHSAFPWRRVSGLFLYESSQTQLVSSFKDVFHSQTMTHDYCRLFYRKRELLIFLSWNNDWYNNQNLCDSCAVMLGVIKRHTFIEHLY